MSKVSMFHPAVNAYREITKEAASKFVDSALEVEAKLSINPNLSIISMYDPAIDAYYEISKDIALQFIESAKEVSKLLV